MKNRFERRAYVDLFSGPGRCYEPSSGEFYDGSPLIGLKHAFTDHIYVDLDPAAVGALRTRVAPWANGRLLTLVEGDCNARIAEVRAALPRYGLTFAFIDQTNWQIRFDTLATLCANRRVDLLVSFFGQAVKRVAHLEDQPCVDAFFGTKDWRQYNGSRGRPTLGSLLACYRDQLATLGYPKRLAAREITIRNTKNAPIYLLAFFSKHERGYEFWDKITTEDEKGQLAVQWAADGSSSARARAGSMGPAGA